jgi:hypothetical protein
MRGGNPSPRITKEAIMATNAKKPEAVKEAVATIEETPEVVEPAVKKVKIRIPRTKANEEDVFVSVNMETFIVKRGVEVEVPDYVAEVIQHQEEQLEKIMLFNEERGN